jgi:sec-independent protein translocase protein TatA
LPILSQEMRSNRYASRMPFGIGIWELLILLLVLLLVFGPKRLPEMGRQLGKGMREFKDSVSGNSDDDVVDEVAELPPAVEPTTTATTARERDTVS